MWRRMFSPIEFATSRSFSSTGEKVVVQEPFGPLMGGGTSSCGVVAGVDAQAAVDQRVRVMVTEVDVQPMAGGDQRRIRVRGVGR